MTILDQLADHARERVAAPNGRPPGNAPPAGPALPKGDFPFEKAQRRRDFPSSASARRPPPPKGLSHRFSPIWKSQKSMRRRGRTASQCSPSPSGFLGSDRYLQEITKTVSTPCLRKDFTVDEYMLYEAKLLGASAVLLICSILTEAQIRKFLHICDELGLSALVEIHDATEAETALRAGARIVGVNNRT